MSYEPPFEFLSRSASARSRIAQVIEKHPDLGLYGFWRPISPILDSPTTFVRDRRALLQSRHVRAFRWAHAVLSIRSHSLLPDHSDSLADTTRLRFVIQDASEALCRHRVIVQEGTIIAAALALGFRVERAPDGRSGRIEIRTPEVVW